MYIPNGNIFSKIVFDDYENKFVYEESKLRLDADKFTKEHTTILMHGNADKLNKLMYDFLSDNGIKEMWHPVYAELMLLGKYNETDYVMNKDEEGSEIATYDVTTGFIDTLVYWKATRTDKDIKYILYHRDTRECDTFETMHDLEYHVKNANIDKKMVQVFKEE